MNMASLKLNINTATPEELSKLYNIGPKSLSAIEHLRKQKLSEGSFVVVKDFHENPQLESTLHHLIEVGEITDGDPNAYTPSTEQSGIGSMATNIKNLMQMMQNFNERIDKFEARHSKDIKELECRITNQVKGVEERMEARLKKLEQPQEAKQKGAIPKTKALPKTEVPSDTLLHESTEKSFRASVASFIKSNPPPVPSSSSQKTGLQELQQKSEEKESECESPILERKGARNPEIIVSRSSRPERGRFSSKKLFSPKIQPYDGKDDFRLFLVKIELLAESYEWNENEKLVILVQNLTGKPLDIFSKQKPEDRRSFKITSEKLLRIFGKDDSPPVIRTQLMVIKQNEDELTDDFGQRVMQLVLQAYPDASACMIDTLGIEAFMRGAFDKYAVEIAMIREPKTLTEAVNFMKVAQSNHSLLSQGSRGKLRQVSFEDEPKVHRLQDEWSSPSEDEGIASTMREMMALIQKISDKLDPSIQPASQATPESPGRFSSVHT